MNEDTFVEFYDSLKHYQEDHTWLDDDEDLAPAPPPSLGPFGVTSVQYKNIGLVVHNSGSKGPCYEVDTSKQSLHVLTMISGQAQRRGPLSIISPVTLSPTVRDEAGIPRKALSFAFAYPLPGAAAASDRGRLNMSDPAISFLVLGGFIYFDDSRRVCGVNALLCQG